MVLNIFLLVFLLAMIFWQGSLLQASIRGVPIVYSSKKAAIDALKLARAKSGETVVDLGCGNGQVLINLADHFGVKGVGVDLSLFCYISARAKLFLSRRSDRIKIIRGDFRLAERELKEADIVYLYLLNPTLAKIEDWLFATIGEKTRVVSLSFEFKKHKPVDTIETKNLGYPTLIRLYRK